MKLRTRIFLIFLLIMGLGLVLLFYWADRTALPIYLASLEDDLVETAAILTTFLERESRAEHLNLEALGGLVHQTNQRQLDADIYERHKSRAEFRVTVTDPNGRVIYDSEDGLAVGQDFSQWNDVARTLQGAYGARATWVEDNEERILALYVALPVIVGGRLSGALTVSKRTTVVYGFRPHARKQAFLGIGLWVLMVLLGGLAVSLWVSQPIRRLIGYVEAVSGGSRVASPSLGSSEIGQLARAFGTMRQALDGKGYVEGYVQTLTHEIKSPLSAIRGAAELIDDQMPASRRAIFLNHIRMETERIQQLIDRLLELSGLESRVELRQVTDVDLGAIARVLLGDAQPAIDQKNLTVRFAPEDGICISGEAFLLRLAISNLLQNAIAFAPNGGWLEVAFGRRSIRITDSGPGIPDYAGKRIFQRFFSLPRTETGRKSSGLGLSIVRQIAELHQGGVQLQNAKNAGAQAILWFPMDRVMPASPKVITATLKPTS